jgi:ERCC4-related helicase
MENEEGKKNFKNSRNYQIEAYKKALNENIIIVSGTGTGKTKIASILIKDYYEAGKKSFFLVNTVNLVRIINE